MLDVAHWPDLHTLVGYDGRGDLPIFFYDGNGARVGFEAEKSGAVYRKEVLELVETVEFVEDLCIYLDRRGGVEYSKCAA